MTPRFLPYLSFGPASKFHPRPKPYRPQNRLPNFCASPAWKKPSKNSGGKDGRESATCHCVWHSKAKPTIIPGEIGMKENLCTEDNKKKSVARCRYGISFPRLHISARYISSAALTGLLTLSACVCAGVHAATTKLSTHQLTAAFSANASLHQLSQAFA